METPMAAPVTAHAVTPTAATRMRYGSAANQPIRREQATALRRTTIQIAPVMRASASVVARRSRRTAPHQLVREACPECGVLL
jgi:hypothetical protein